MSKYSGFNQVELTRPTRSHFDFSHERRLSTRMGRLTPIFMTEVLPNDTWSGNTEVMLRLAPLLAPIMHRVNVFVHHFYVPARLLSKEFETFITGGRLGAAVTNPPVPPHFKIQDITDTEASLLDIGSLADYLGVPPIPDASGSTYGDSTLDAMPWAAYYKVWYDYYRDRNFVEDNEVLPLEAGELTSTSFPILELQTRCWEHDYFTSAQTNTQRGAEVLIPMEGSGSVTYLPASQVYDNAGVSASGNLNMGTSVAVGGGQLVVEKSTLSDGVPGRIENIDDVEFTNSSVSINDFRQAVVLQKWLERNQLAGSRMNESIMAHFGRKTSDARLQRAEYLGGGKVPVQISEVVTTAYSEDGADVVPPGNMAGHGITYGNKNGLRYNAEEWGFIISIMSVMPTSGYMQGLPDMFQRRNSFLDYPWPTFANLGEQEVYKYELYMNPTNLTADRTEAPLFGYQSRYVNWKQMSSSSHGNFRTDLDFWHLTRKFSSSPVLGNTFVTFEDALQDRIFAVSGVDTLWCYIYNNLHVKRALPYFGTPRL